MANAKVLVVGWDGADWSRIKPLLDDMPNLKGLMENGSYGNLTSVMPFISPAAWSSMVTGLKPEEHGISNFLERGTMKPLTSRDVKGKRVWETLGEKGIRVAAINIPQTYPPQQVNGILVGGYLSVEGTNFTYPANLTKTLVKGGYIVEAMNQEYSKLKRAELLEHLNKTVNKRTQFALELMDQEDFGFFMIVYTGLDRLQHYFWSDKQYSEAIANHYIKLDKVLGELIKKYQPDQVLVVSDHGFMKLEGELYLNNLLAELGYLKLKHPPGILERLGITQQWIAGLINRFPVLEYFRNLFARQSSLPKPGASNIDTLNSKAYSFAYGGQIYINAEGEEYEEIKAAIKQELLKLEYQGEKIVTQIHEFQGDARTPDLIVECPGWDAVGFLGYKGIINTHQIKSGTHRLNGIWVYSGKANLTSIPAVTPFILSLYE